MDDDDDNNFGASKNGVNAFLVTWKKSRHFNHSITNSIINTIQEIMHPPIKHILKIISWLDPWSVSWLTLDKESITFIISPWKYLIVCISIMIYPKKTKTTLLCKYIHANFSFSSSLKMKTREKLVRQWFFYANAKQPT